MTPPQAKPNLPALPKNEQITFGVNKWTHTPRGTIVADEIDKFGAAGKAGMRVGDEMLAIQGVRLASKGPDSKAIEKFFLDTMVQVGAGNPMKVQFVRAGKTLEVAVVLKKKKLLALDLEEVSEVLERKIAP